MRYFLGGSKTVLPLRCIRRAHGQDRPIPAVVSREREKKHLGVSQHSRFWREPKPCLDSPPANLRPSTWSPILSDAVRYHLMSSWILEYYVSRISARYRLPMTLFRLASGKKEEKKTDNRTIWHVLSSMDL